MIPIKSYQYKVTDPRVVELNKSDTITIYENDLKYKKYNQIDQKRISNNNKKEEDHDTISFRIKELIEKNDNMLDLAHLGIDRTPDLSKVKDRIKYLFMADNSFSEFPPITFSNLVVLDISNNKITNLNNIPKTVKELVVRNNRLESLDGINGLNLEVLDCSNNLIRDIPMVNTLKTLICDDNRIELIKKYPNLRRLSCSNNNINKIEPMDQLKTLECDHNQIKKIDSKNLVELYCSHNRIISLVLKNVEVIHCCSNNISRIGFFPTLKELVCDRKNLAISRRYNIISAEQYGETVQFFFKNDQRA